MNADDWVKVIGAIASGLVLVLASATALWVKLDAYHKEVNGTQEALLDLTRKSAHAEGILEEQTKPANQSGGPVGPT